MPSYDVETGCECGCIANSTSGYVQPNNSCYTSMPMVWILGSPQKPDSLVEFTIQYRDQGRQSDGCAKAVVKVRDGVLETSELLLMDRLSSLSGDFSTVRSTASVMRIEYHRGSVTDCAFVAFYSVIGMIARVCLH